MTQRRRSWSGNGNNEAMEINGQSILPLWGAYKLAWCLRIPIIVISFYYFEVVGGISGWNDGS